MADGTSGALMPAAFIGHGSPMNALETNRYTESWHAFGESVPKPTAILVVSAHWYINATAVTAMPRPRTIHDFYGFPQALFDVEYPAPGMPEMAKEISDIVEPTWVGADLDSWGIDHGTWSVLVHAFPQADIPVVQLSINADKGLDYHLELGAKLAPLRERGVLIVGSGNVVHNLRAIDRIEGLNARASRPWAQAFDDAVKNALAARDDMALVNYARLAGDSAATAVQTPDHYFPFLYALGASDSLSEKATSVFEGFQAGTLSMRCVQFGA